MLGDENDSSTTETIAKQRRPRLASKSRSDWSNASRSAHALGRTSSAAQGDAADDGLGSAGKSAFYRRSRLAPPHQVRVGTVEILGLNLIVGHDCQALGIGLVRMNENDQDAAPIGRFVLRILNAQVAVLAAPPHGDRFRSKPSLCGKRS